MKETLPSVHVNPDSHIRQETFSELYRDEGRGYIEQEVNTCSHSIIIDDHAVRFEREEVNLAFDGKNTVKAISVFVDEDACLASTILPPHVLIVFLVSISPSYDFHFCDAIIIMDPALKQYVDQFIDPTASKDAYIEALNSLVLNVNRSHCFIPLVTQVPHSPLFTLMFILQG